MRESIPDYAMEQQMIAPSQMNYNAMSNMCAPPAMMQQQCVAGFAEDMYSRQIGSLGGGGSAQSLA